MIVEFTQFVYPDGHRKQVDIEIEDEYQPLVDHILLKGYNFEIECNPNTQLVYMDVCNTEKELAAEFVGNGPYVVDRVKKLIREAYDRL
jgi:hypothetical protein